jgi:hypothetical protein
MSENADGILKESPDPCERMLAAFSENARGILKESPDPCERMLPAFSENARGILKESPDPCERMLPAFSENARGILKESPDPCERMLTAFLKNAASILEEFPRGSRRTPDICQDRYDELEELIHSRTRTAFRKCSLDALATASTNVVSVPGRFHHRSSTSATRRRYSSVPSSISYGFGSSGMGWRTGRAGGT